MNPLRRLLSNSILSDRRVTLSALIVSGGFLLSKLTGLAREILIARTFGTRAELDAFFAATSFSDLLFAVIAGGAIASVFIPVLSTFLAGGQARREEAWRFASAVLNDIFLVVSIFSLLGMVFAQPVVDHVLAPGFDPELRLLTASLLRLVLISTILLGVSGTLTGLLHAHNLFVLPALAPPLYNLGMIWGILLLAPAFGINGLVYGLLGGSVLHLGIQLPGLWRAGARYFATLGAGQEGMRRLLGLFGPRIVTMGVVRVNNLIMTNLASRLAEGSISALSFAYSLWQFPESLIGTAIALAVFPRLSARAAAAQSQSLRRLYRQGLLTILGLSVPAALVTVMFARPLVALFFQRGAFDAGSTELVARVLQFYAVAIVGESLLELTARLFYAHQDSRTPMWVALGSMLVRAALMSWWSEPLGAAGLALAYGVGVSLEGGALYWLGQKRLNSSAWAAGAVASAPQLE